MVCSMVGVCSMVVLASTQTPLRVVAVTPTAQLAGAAAITVTFSRAVIALGSDFRNATDPFVIEPAVAGSMRWVTTSVARFDPKDGEWPPEHHNLKLTVNVPGLERPPTYLYATPQLVVTALRVHSEMANAVTNNSWSADAHHPLRYGALEIPADGHVELQFSYDIQHDLLQAALLVHEDQTGIRFADADNISVQPCRNAPRKARCAFVSFASALATNTLYRLELPAGSVVHPAAGQLGESKAFYISGLLPFEVPFKQPSLPQERWGELRPQYRRYNVWLRHGLSPAVSASAMCAQLSLAPTVALTCTRPSAGLLQVSGDLVPSTTYNLTVAANESIRDGFGLPLLRSSSVFRTAKIQGFFLEPQGGQWHRAYSGSAVRFQSSAVANASWPILVRGDDLCLRYPYVQGCPGRDVRHTTIVSVGVSDGEIKDALASLHNSRSVFLREGELELSARPLSPTLTSRVVSLGLLGSALMLKTTFNSYSATSILLSQGR